MKKFSLLLLLTVFFIGSVFAQNTPRGMKYQAVARDLKGEVLANSKIDLRINLLGGKSGKQDAFYSEVHSVVTNQLGLFTLVIGEGKKVNGDFETIPWGTTDIWMEIQIKTRGNADFTSISNSQLLAVPYAYYAVTAGQLAKGVLDQNAVLSKELPPTCSCEDGINQITLLYSGTPGVNINVYDDPDLQASHLITSFAGINTGAVLEINSLPSDKFKDVTYVQVDGKVIEIPTKCDYPIVGENFGSLSVLSRRDKRNNTICSVCDVNADWHVGGNGVMDLCNWMGTRSNTDLVLITNNIERLKITKDGDVTIQNHLTVNKNTNLNGTLDVNNMSSTNLSGTLSVNKNVTFNDETQSNTKDDGAVVLEGGMGIEKNLNVGGALTVTGLATLSNLSTTSTSSKSLTITDNNPSYLATFENTNTGDGDGIKIILGRRHPLHPSLGTSAFTLPSLSQNPFQNTTSAFQTYFGNLISSHGTFNADNLLSAAGSGLLSDMGNVAQLLASKLVDITNIVINKVNDGIGAVNSALSLPFNMTAPINNGLGLPFNLTKPINDGLNLPYKIGPYGVPYIQVVPEVIGIGPYGFGPINVVPQITVMPSLPAVNIPKIPDLTLPAIPNIPTIPPVDPGPLGNLSINFTFPWDAVNDPLTNENEFIAFYDKNGTKAGAIRGESLGDWFTNYFDIPWILTTAESFLSRYDEDAGGPGAITPFKMAAKAISTTIQFGYDFSQMGVEYSSGNGDYAEWLERENPKEVISYGDIVAVKGGKITKDIAGAEQIMAVSHQPIVLGNIPEKGKTRLGNNIAFMGQIPVKVMGPVEAGDYIVADSEIPGYGIAIKPENMRVEDYKLAVGRSWVTNGTDGPKMVNTVVGVHNNGFLTILKEMQEKSDNYEARLRAIEARLNLPSTPEKAKEKKAFK